MIANAEQALENLRHARTGALLPTKNIAQNTKLVYLDDELVGLRYHDTIIARYTPTGVVIDTRDRWHPNGWWTVSTWDRIDRFTPARTATRSGLRYICKSTDRSEYGWLYARENLRLFTHGCEVDAEGDLLRNPLDPSVEPEIIRITQSWGQRTLKNYAARCVTTWKKWEIVPDCCIRAHNNAHVSESLVDWLDHQIEHIERREPVVIPWLHEEAERLLGFGSYQGDALLSELRKRLTKHLREQLVPRAIERVAPGFPFPQLTRRQ